MILPRHRKTEPKLLWWTKVIISVILLGGLIGYLGVLINLIKNEEPSIQYSYQKLDSPLFPSMLANYYPIEFMAKQLTVYKLLK